MGTVIQLVTLGLEERSQPGRLHGPGHAATALDSMTDAAHFVLYCRRRWLFQRGQSLMQVGYDGGIDFPDRRLGHELAELGQRRPGS